MKNIAKLKDRHCSWFLYFLSSTLIKKIITFLCDFNAVKKRLADLYDDLTMPVEFRRAHQANDHAVMEAYGFAATMTESDIVARLLEMYEQSTTDNC